MQNQGEDQPCRIKLEWLPTKHQVPKQGAREFLRLNELRDRNASVTRPYRHLKQAGGQFLPFANLKRT